MPIFQKHRLRLREVKRLTRGHQSQNSSPWTSCDHQSICLFRRAQVRPPQAPADSGGPAARWTLLGRGTDGVFAIPKRKKCSCSQPRPHLLLSVPCHPRSHNATGRAWLSETLGCAMPFERWSWSGRRRGGEQCQGPVAALRSLKREARLLLGNYSMTR